MVLPLSLGFAFLLCTNPHVMTSFFLHSSCLVMRLTSAEQVWLYLLSRRNNPSLLQTQLVCWMFTSKLKRSSAPKGLLVITDFFKYTYLACFILSESGYQSRWNVKFISCLKIKVIHQKMNPLQKQEHDCCIYIWEIKIVSCFRGMSRSPNFSKSWKSSKFIITLLPSFWSWYVRFYFVKIYSWCIPPPQMYRFYLPPNFLHLVGHVAHDAIYLGDGDLDPLAE